MLEMEMAFVKVPYLMPTRKRHGHLEKVVANQVHKSVVLMS